MFSHHFSENTVHLIETCYVFVKIEVIYIESGENLHSVKISKIGCVGNLMNLLVELLLKLYVSFRK